MPLERAARLERLNELDEVMQRAHPGRAPLSEGQRTVILRAFDHAAPFSAEQRLKLLRLLRTSAGWQRLRASAQREQTVP